MKNQPFLTIHEFNVVCLELAQVLACFGDFEFVVLSSVCCLFLAPCLWCAWSVFELSMIELSLNDSTLDTELNWERIGSSILSSSSLVSLSNDSGAAFVLLEVGVTAFWHSVFPDGDSNFSDPFNEVGQGLTSLIIRFRKSLDLLLKFNLVRGSRCALR